VDLVSLACDLAVMRLPARAIRQPPCPDLNQQDDRTGIHLQDGI